MSRLNILITAVFVTACGSLFAEPAADLQALLQPVAAIKANFKQTVYNERQKVIQTASGNLEFKRPNLFRWQVELPDANLVVTDGNKLWNYDVELEQVTVQDFTANKQVSPVSFLFDDVKKLKQDFIIIKSGNNNFKLTPRKENSNFVNVEVTFKANKISALRLLDHLNQTSVFDFKQVQNNPKLDNTRFTFVPPAGVDVISEL